MMYRNGNNREQILKRLNESSFAVNELTLYLDTHPEDERAMQMFRENMMTRTSCLNEYARNFGPLTIDTADDTASRSWQWMQQPWPWEGQPKGGCR